MLRARLFKSHKDVRNTNAPALLISAILAPFLLKPKKISSTGPMKFGKTPWRESCC